MKKQDAIKLFGNTLDDLGKALGRGKSAISQWPEELDEDKTNMVIGAAVRRGIEIPESILRCTKHNRRTSDMPRRRATDAMHRRASDAEHNRRSTDQML